VAKRGLGAFSGSGRRRRVAAGLALLAVAAVVAVVVLSAGSASPGSAAGSPTVSGATTVQRRNLVQTDTEAGTLSYNNPQTVYNRLSGTITWLPNVGDLIRAGGTLYKVDGYPVVLMDGSTPAYRTLSSADTTGEDVLELNRNLVDLGFNADGITVDDVWQPGTTLGVELLQASLGETETGSLSLGQMVFLPGPQLVSTVDATVGSTGTGSGSPADTVVGPPAPEFVSYRVPHQDSSTQTATTTTTSTTTTSATAPSTTTSTQTTTAAGTKPRTRPSKKSGGGSTAQTLAALTALLRAEEQQLRAEEQQLQAERGSGSSGNGSGGSHGSGSHGSGSGGSHGSGSGGSHGSGSGGSHGSGSGSSGSGSSGSGSGGNAQEILQTTSTRLVVTVDLSASSQSEAVVGEHVTVEMPNGNTVNGRITAVSPIAQSSSSGNGGSGSGSGGGGGGGNGSGNGNGSGGSSSSSTIPVTITLSGHHRGAGLDQAAVSVNFAQAKANNVLSVPVTALLATGGGNYAVQEAAAPHQLIPVTTGLFAAGYVQISGSGIYEGLQVTDSQG
jgi:membrane fusion protein, multidrug efflux system